MLKGIIITLYANKYNGFLYERDFLMSLLNRTWAEISLDNALHNFNIIKEKVNNKAKICCVIKADGYGHGAVALAHAYENAGADFFAVSNIDEGIELRNSSITKPILILGYTPVALAKQLCDYDISQAVFDEAYAQSLIEQCEKDNIRIKAHIKLDTGMSRIGFMCQKFPRDNATIDKIESVLKSDRLIAEGIFTHFCVSDEAEKGEEFTENQYECFTHTIDLLKQRGIAFEIAHCSNSGAIEDYPKTHCDMVRAGIILYGLSPSSDIRNKLDLKPVMTLKSTVSLVKQIKKGATVSYGRTFKADKDMTVATVPVGYADGYIRDYKDGYMLINGKKAPIVGRICMDQTMVDVTDISSVRTGDEVILFGSGENGELTADDLAKMTDTINYEVVCLVSKRVPRIMIENGIKTDVMYKL